MKTIFCALLIGSSLVTFGQESNDSTSTQLKKFSPQDRSLEVLISPFAATPISLNQFKFRYFNSPNSALRLTANISSSSSSTVTQFAVDSTNTPELKNKSSNFTLMLSPGYEHHFAGTSRFSPYIGGALDFGFSRSTSSTQTQVGKEAVEVKVINGQVSDGNGGMMGPKNPGYFSIGVSGFAGFDYYLTNYLFLGTEFGLGIAYQSLSNVKVKSDAKDFKEPNPIPQGSNFNIAKNVNGAIRLGFLF